MGPRLDAILQMVSPGRGLVDVGTDHGYLPIRLAKEGYPGDLFASDIREGPLSTAKKNAEQSGAAGRIRFLLCDGLDACPPEAVDTIVIAGMGGDTICGILDRAEWCMDPRFRLILQPMTKAEILRYWLCHNGFRIEKESLADEGGAIYQILCAAFCGENEKLSDAELWLGKRGLADPELYRRLLDREIGRVGRQIDGLSDTAEQDRLRQLAALRQRLKELKEMRENRYDDGQ